MIGITDPAMYLHKSNQDTVLRNRELKEQCKAALAEQDQRRATMDCAAAALIHTRTQMGRSTKVGDVEYFLRRMDRSVGGECDDNDCTAVALYNAQDTLAYERARFRADCAARAIRTAADAEKHMNPISVARAEVVRHNIYGQRVTLNIFFAGRRLWGGAPSPRQRAG